MERAISQEERIRRAEEIYSRRKSQNSRREEYATLNVGEKREYGLFKRMTIQIIACLMIYSAFYGIQNSKDIFSEQIINKAKEIMAYDVDIEQLRDKVLENVNKLKNIGVIIPVENQEVVKKDENTNTEEINLQTQTLLEQGAKTLM